MEDQILQVDKTQEATPDANLSKKLLKKEQRLSLRLQEEQEAEARAQDRFQRAQTRLQRRISRLERISGKLLLVRKQIADLQITDQQSAHTESTLVIPATFEAEALSPYYTEYTTPTISETESRGYRYKRELKRSSCCPLQRGRGGRAGAPCSTVRDARTYRDYN